MLPFFVFHLSQSWIVIVQNLSNVHKQDFHILILPKKRVFCNIFGNKLSMDDVLLIYFEQVVSFWSQIQAYVSFFVKNDQKKVIFLINS